MTIYHPALNRFFVHDQLAYFAELDGDRSLSAGLRLLDYAYTRELAKGDELLYRPLMFIWLALNNRWFALDIRASGRCLCAV